MSQSYSAQRNTANEPSPMNSQKYNKPIGQNTPVYKVGEQVKVIGGDGSGQHGTIANIYPGQGVLVRTFSGNDFKNKFASIQKHRPVNPPIPMPQWYTQQMSQASIGSQSSTQRPANPSIPVPQQSSAPGMSVKPNVKVPSTTSEAGVNGNKYNTLTSLVDAKKALRLVGVDMQKELSPAVLKVLEKYGLQDSIEIYVMHRHCVVKDDEIQVEEYTGHCGEGCVLSIMTAVPRSSVKESEIFPVRWTIEEVQKNKFVKIPMEFAKNIDPKRIQSTLEKLNAEVIDELGRILKQLGLLECLGISYYDDLGGKRSKLWVSESNKWTSKGMRSIKTMFSKKQEGINTSYNPKHLTSLNHPNQPISQPSTGITTMGLATSSTSIITLPFPIPHPIPFPIPHPKPTKPKPDSCSSCGQTCTSSSCVKLGPVSIDPQSVLPCDLCKTKGFMDNDGKLCKKCEGRGETKKDVLPFKTTQKGKQPANQV